MNIKSRLFTIEDQIAFAKLSGDYNPLHIDPIRARRTIFGQPVVHGVHSLCWALQEWLKDKNKSIRLQTIKAEFESPIGLDQLVSCQIAEDNEANATIQLEIDRSTVTKIDIRFEYSNRMDDVPIPSDCPGADDCKVIGIESAQSVSGMLELCLEQNLFESLFPGLISYLPAHQIATILCTTRVIGMRCPGLHSIFSGLDLSFSPEIPENRNFAYKVIRFNPRFSMFSIKVDASAATGTLKAFVRPAPYDQISYDSVKKEVVPYAFSDQRALIIGGSRGLGEVTAKILAAGGADVKITYSQGLTDAKRVVEEIVYGGGLADYFTLDVLSSSDADGLNARSMPTHLYYFATPAIFQGKKGTFSYDLFKRFCDYYIRGLVKTVNTFRNENLKMIFYPSTVAVDEIPSHMGEYVAAKTAGEIVCSYLEKMLKGTRVHSERLPRMATDQTRSLLPGDNEDPVRYMLDILRRVGGK